MFFLIIGQLYALTNSWNELIPAEVITGVIVTSILVGRSAWITWAVIKRRTKQLRMLTYISAIVFFDFVNFVVILISRNISQHEIQEQN